jgi:hypothetical protein
LGGDWFDFIGSGGEPPSSDFPGLPQIVQVAGKTAADVVSGSAVMNEQDVDCFDSLNEVSTLRLTLSKS